MYVNSADSRSRLMNVLVEFRSEYSLIIPHLCRLVTVLAQHLTDIVEPFYTKLMLILDQCRDAAKQDLANSNQRVQCIRFLSELTKFSVLEPYKLLNVLKYLIDDLQANPNNVDAITVLLEQAGKYIFMNEDTTFRF